MADTEIRRTGTVPASGTVSLSISPRARQTYIVKQVGINAPNVGGGAVGKVTKNGAMITPFVATGDAPAGEPYIYLRASSDVCAAVWTGATVGASVEAVFFIDDGT